jgi:hypothetical protein
MNFSKLFLVIPLFIFMILSSTPAASSCSLGGNPGTCYAPPLPAITCSGVAGTGGCGAGLHCCTSGFPTPF